MRKVFLSVMLLSEMKPERKAHYISDDFDLTSKDYDFPLTYIIDENVQSGDTISVITAVEKTADGTINNAMENYQKYMNEISTILQERNVKPNFIEIPLTSDFDALTFNKFFKQVSDTIQDNDQLFSDITFGMKPYSFSMFIAIAYAAKAAKNVDVDTIIYANRYNGSSGEKVPANTSKIYDLTGLFYLNAIASSAKPGQKNSLDKALGLIIDND